MATVQFATLPSFQSLLLPDSAPLGDAVRYILTTLLPRKGLGSNVADSTAQWVAAITAQTGAISVGDVRLFTDIDFRTLQVPAMLRIYLKHLVRGAQAGRPHATQAAGALAAPPTPAASPSPSPSSSGGSSSVDPFILALQNDFNFGQAFDMSLYRANLDTLAVMGFSTSVSLEALCMVENKDVEAACELLLSTDAQQRKDKRARVVERLGRQAKQTPKHAQAAAAASVEEPSQALAALQSELALARLQVSKERSARTSQAAEYKVFVSTTLPLQVYTEHLRSLLAKEYILPLELEQLAKYRTRNGIDARAHSVALTAVGVADMQALEAMVKKAPSGGGAGGNVQQPGDMDCVVCLDKPKAYAIFNCMHLCLCEDCAQQWIKTRHPATGAFTSACPICSKKITQIARIYV